MESIFSATDAFWLLFCTFLQRPFLSLLVFRQSWVFNWVQFQRTFFTKLCLITLSPYPAAQRRNIKISMRFSTRIAAGSFDYVVIALKAQRVFSKFIFLVNDSWFYLTNLFGQFGVQQNGFHNCHVWLWIVLPSAGTRLRKSDLAWWP